MTVTLMPGTESSEYGGVSVGVVEGGVGIAMMSVGEQCEPPGMGVMNNVAWLLIITSRDLYWSALSYTITTIDHSSNITDILLRYVW